MKEPKYDRHMWDIVEVKEVRSVNGDGAQKVNEPLEQGWELLRDTPVQDRRQDGTPYLRYILLLLLLRWAQLQSGKSSGSADESSGN